MSPDFDETRWRAVFEDVCAPYEFVSARPLTGGISAETAEIQYVSPAGTLCKLVGRRHGAADLARNPRIAYDELRLLELLRDAEVPAPIGIGVSDRGIFPNPVIITSFVERSADRPIPVLTEHAAALLARIHRQSATPRYAFLPRITNEVPAAPDRLDRAMGEDRIRKALDSFDPPSSVETTLLHGDFWPGNLLWDERRVLTAIDWEDAAIGDPLADLANARLEWRLTYGARAATLFTERYRTLTERELTTLPWWDLRAALGMCGKLESFGLEPAVKRRWRDEHRRFVDEAIARLASAIS